MATAVLPAILEREYGASGIICPAEIMTRSEGTYNPGGAQAWESAHVCPKCDFAIALSTLEMGAVTTGLVTCPRCDWEGRIEIEVVDANRLES
jgi:hypothetical protein